MLARLFPHVYEGWIVVAASSMALFILSASVFWGLGPIFNPLIDEFGWSHGATAFAFAVRSEVNGAAAPFVGALIDRIGSRLMMMVGLVVASCCLFLLSFMQNILHFYVLMLIMALGTSTCGGQATMVSTVSWFERKRARALALATAGGTLGGLLVIVVAVIVESFGWRGALRGLALLLLVGGVLAGSNVRMRPRGHHQPLDGIPRSGGPGRAGEDEDDERWGASLRDALRTQAFWLLALAQFTVFFAMTAIVVLHVPFMEDEVGLSKTAAGVGSAVFALASLGGRIVSGSAADRYDKRVVLAVVVLIAGAAMPVFALVQNLWQASLVLLVISAGVGGANPIRTALLADYYGTRSFGAINGVAMLIGTFGAFLGPWLMGLSVDVTGGYATGFMATGVVALLAIPLVLRTRAPEELMARYRRRAVRAVQPGPPRSTPAAPRG
ncbi:MAG: MFS transporter [Chloroflexi bacterium]|nr:MFS transporter [Chloroflexota bacterium]